MVQVLVFVNLLLLVVFPLYFLIRLTRKKEANRIKFVLDWVFVAVWIVLSYQCGIWTHVGGYCTQYLMLTMLMVGFLVSLYRYKGIKKTQATVKTYVFGCINGLLAVLIVSALWEIKAGKEVPERVVELEFPLRGERYYVAQGGSNEVVNHHFPVSSQRYALDISQLTPLGLRAYSLFPTDLSSYPIFGENLYSPCTGTIIDRADEYPDQNPPLSDPEHPCGNFLAIRTEDEKVVIFLAHLQKGSLLKQVGDRVEQGELIAKIGNSGNTTEPHLHIHAVDSASSDYLFEGEGIPITFDGVFYVRNDLINKL